MVDGELSTQLSGCTVNIAGDVKMKSFTYDGVTYSNSVKLNSKGSVVFTPDKDCIVTLCYYDYVGFTNGLRATK